MDPAVIAVVRTSYPVTPVKRTSEALDLPEVHTALRRAIGCTPRQVDVFPVVARANNPGGYTRRLGVGGALFCSFDSQLTIGPI
jgi:hypothetical protein